jgi:hypothetical protein
MDKDLEAGVVLQIPRPMSQRLQLICSSHGVVVTHSNKRRGS